MNKRLSFTFSLYTLPKIDLRALEMNREPTEFAAGDTLAWQRNLRDYPAGAGWSLDYEMRGGAQAISFRSAAQGDSHLISVPMATTAGWLAGDYILVGFAVSANERHQIYYGDCKIWPDAQAMAGDAPVKTFAQQMVEKIEAVLLGTATSDILESRIGETLFRYLTPEQLQNQHGYWVNVRRNEIAMQRARAGLPTGTKIRPRMNVTQVGIGPAIGGVGILGR